MFSSLRTRFGVPGVISVIALVFAMFGGAYAASNSSGGGKATSSAKAKKGPRGPKGATGPAGPAGPAGPTGADAQGPAGSNGKDGTSGSNGKSVVVGEETPGPECFEGGATVQVAGEPSTKKAICNGEEGPQGNPGAPGSPWVVGAAPSGVTLKGTWAVHTNAAAAGEQIPISISTGVPVPGAYTIWYLTPANQGNESDPTGCSGTADVPTPGNAGIICVYEATSTNITGPAGFLKIINSVVSGANGGGTVGKSSAFTATAPGVAEALGTWAFKTN